MLCCAFYPISKTDYIMRRFSYIPIDRNKSIRGDFHLDEKKCSFPHHGFSILILYSGSRVNIKLSFRRRRRRRIGFFSFRMETSTFFLSFGATVYEPSSRNSELPMCPFLLCFKSSLRQIFRSHEKLMKKYLRR